MKKLVTLSGRTLLLLALSIGWQHASGQFTPGEGGSIPTFSPFTGIPGKISGLYVHSSDRENITPSGTRASLQLNFYKPSLYKATSYTLQFSTNNGSTWANYQVSGVDLITTDSILNVNPEGSYHFRLFVNGGTYDGYTSNEVDAPLSEIDTRFIGLSINETNLVTGVTPPFVGRGLAATVTVNRLSNGLPITGHLTYQWYRVNPATSETTPIIGATSLNYTTTLDDVGYRLMVRATGDGVNVGGYAQIMSGQRTTIPNKSFISNLSGSGFTLNLYKTVSGLTVDGLWLYDHNSQPVLITALTQGGNAAIYNISATLDFINGPFYLNTAIPNFWSIATELHVELYTFTMEGILIDYETGTAVHSEEDLTIYPIPAINAIHFKAGAQIRQAEIVSVNGATVEQSGINNRVGSLNTSGLSPGIYFLRLKTSEGVLIRKIEIKH